MDSNRLAYLEGNSFGYVWDDAAGDHGLGWGQWTGNYVNDPDQPDNIGTKIPEP